MARRHQEHLRDYMNSHRKGRTSDATETRYSSRRSENDVPVLFTSSTRSRASYLIAKKQIPVKITGTATINHLPDEILLKIFSYLTAGELLMAASVCKRWMPVANDGLLWEKIIVRQCKVQKASIPDSVDNPSQYKQWFIKSICSNRNKKALKMVKRISPFTGLPRDFDKALKSSGVYFQLTLVDHDQTEHVFNSNDTFYHQMAASVRWYSVDMPKVRSIRRILVHAVNPLFFGSSGSAVWNSPYQRSLLLDTEFNWTKWLQTCKPLGTDDMVNLYSLPNNLSVATWKSDGEVAFICLGLHCNQLVQRCLLGSPSQPFDLGAHKVTPDDIDSLYGLHGYRCTVDIRTLRNSIWSQQFNNLDCKKENIGSGFAVFPLIRKDHQYDHVILQKNLQFPWKTDAFRGIVDKVVWLDVTVLDEKNELFWCVSSMTRIAEQSLQKNYDFDYSSEDCFTLVHMDEKGKVEAQLSKRDDGSYFMTVLNLKLSLSAINDWFGTNYS